MRKDTRREFAAIPILLALLGVLFAIMLLAELGTWGWIIFAVACVVALVLVAVLLARRPKHASALDAPSTAARRADEPDGTHRVVVVCDDSCTSPGFVEEIVSHAAGRQLEVFVTAPALGSRLAVDRGRRGAARRRRAPERDAPGARGSGRECPRRGRRP
jgi:hypothetical protein